MLTLSYLLHLIATVVWLGGLATLTLLVWPAARRATGDDPAIRRLFSDLRRRFIPITNFSLAVLIVTGMIQMSLDEHYDGLMQITNDWSRAILLKHLAVGGMIVCGLILQLGLHPALERTGLLADAGKGDPAAYARLRQRERTLTWVNAGLGLTVLIFTAWATAL
jgi:uncharacterized membrane protein